MKIAIHNLKIKYKKKNKFQSKLLKKSQFLNSNWRALSKKEKIYKITSKSNLKMMKNGEKDT